MLKRSCPKCVCNARNGFDKKFLLTFYNSFLKIELNCDKDHVNFKCMQFSKISMTEFTVKEVTIFRVATFLNEAFRQI